MEDKKPFYSLNNDKQIASDRRAEGSYRERDVFRDRYGDRDRDRDRDRRYRGHSPRDDRYYKSSWRDERDERGSRHRDARHDDREERSSKIRDRKTGFDFREQRGSPRSDRYDGNIRDKENRRTRSKSPEIEKSIRAHRGRNSNRPKPVEVGERTTTLPVSFKVGSTSDPDKMEIDCGNKKPKNDRVLKNKANEPHEDEEIMVEEEDEILAMKSMMGFADFGTTNQKKVPGNNVSAVRKEKKTEYRQYMNRVGGFNRPLSPSHSSR